MEQLLTTLLIILSTFLTTIYAFRHEKWKDKNIYLYDGMDNLIIYSDDHREKIEIKNTSVYNGIVGSVKYNTHIENYFLSTYNIKVKRFGPLEKHPQFPLKHYRVCTLSRIEYKKLFKKLK